MYSMIELSHVSDWRSQASKSTPCNILELPGFNIAFSYSTIIGFKKPGQEWQLVENIYSNTTGVHLNLLNDDKASRLPLNEFIEAFNKAWHEAMEEKEDWLI